MNLCIKLLICEIFDYNIDDKINFILLLEYKLKVF